MEFQQLEMFAALVEEGSVSRAAERVCRTPPAVSIAMRKLEDEMGAPLFDRAERQHQELTSTGKVLYSYATRLLQMRREAISSLKDLQGQTGTLRLGTHESTSLYLLPSLLNSFNRRHAGIKTEVVCGPAERLLRALDNRAIELALIGDAPENEKLERHLIKQDELVLITNPAHRLAGMKQVEVRDLAGEFLIVQGTKSMLRARIVKALQASDTPFKLGVENVAIEAIKRMVSEGVGIGFVPWMCVRDEAASGKLVTLKVNDLRSEWPVSLVYRRDRSLSAAARAFIEIALLITEEITETEMAEPVKRQKNVVLRPPPRKSFPIRPRKVIHC